MKAHVETNGPQHILDDRSFPIAESTWCCHLCCDRRGDVSTIERTKTIECMRNLILRSRLRSRASGTLRLCFCVCAILPPYFTLS
jgi:hypothetical protein